MTSEQARQEQEEQKHLADLEAVRIAIDTDDEEYDDEEPADEEAEI